jgi:hypothetical protein
MDEVIHHRRIGERRGVSEIGKVVLGDLAEDAPHDLAERVFGRPGANWIRSGEAIGPISERTQSRSSFGERVVGCLAESSAVTVAVMPLSLMSWGKPTTPPPTLSDGPTSATPPRQVPIRGPDTLMARRPTRPVIQ